MSGDTELKRRRIELQEAIDRLASDDAVEVILEQPGVSGKLRGVILHEAIESDPCALFWRTVEEIEAAEFVEAVKATEFWDAICEKVKEEAVEAGTMVEPDDLSQISDRDLERLADAIETGDKQTAFWMLGQMFGDGFPSLKLTEFLNAQRGLPLHLIEANSRGAHHG